MEGNYQLQGQTLSWDLSVHLGVNHTFRNSLLIPGPTLESATHPRVRRSRLCSAFHSLPCCSPSRPLRAHQLFLRLIINHTKVHHSLFNLRLPAFSTPGQPLTMSALACTKHTAVHYSS
ncbi:hypothetical protein E2C01_061009 [Portunus trituberculatus]|uniref:Uncharacterized protein n=1 Tax=Portunus trituberculatus TaxID=210409 RepID=A0A5B7HDW7_PORTR|nr:hypothetical protein [Portunus trituberculatus]